MSTPEQLFPVIEGHIGSITNAGQSVALWVKQIKEIMLSGQNAFKDDWAFYASTAVTPSAPDVETGAVLYGLLIGEGDADAEEDCVVVDADADGTVTFNGNTTLPDTVRFAYVCEAATADGTFSYYPILFPKGVLISGTNHMCIVSDGMAGTDTASGEVYIWVVYRTGNTRAQS